MTYEQKLEALQMLTDAHVCMRKPGDWYVDQQVEMKENEESHVLVSRYGNGATPKLAILDHWNILTNLPERAFLVVSNGERRLHVRWNGYMWKTL